MNVEVFYVHPDHLGTPRVITASTALAATTGTGITSAQTVNKAVWRWDSDPFGSNATANSAPNENPNTLSQVVGTATLPYLFGFDLAFPGQKRDRETGKHYNYFRDYDPSVGRYLESDPIGLGGGLNTFAYSRSRPCRLTDRYGLFSGADGALAAHFYSGRGGYVDISAWCADYLADTVIQARTQLLKQKIDHKLREYVGLNGKASFSLKQDGSAYITSIYSFGEGGVRTENAECDVEGDGCCVKANCKLKYYAYDRFDDPIDLCQKWGFCGNARNLGGTPFSFGLSCSSSYSTGRCK